MGSMLPYMAYMDPMVIGYTTNDDLVISKMFPLRRSSTLGRSTSTELRSVKRGPEGQRFENRHTVHLPEVPDLMDCHFEALWSLEQEWQLVRPKEKTMAAAALEKMTPFISDLSIDTSAIDTC